MSRSLASGGEFSVQANLVRLFTETLVWKGLDVAALLAHAGMEPLDLQQPEARLPASKFNRLWDLAFELTGDATIALDHARRFQPGTYHVLGFALFSSSTLQDASERCVRYFRVLSDEPYLSCETAGDEFRICVRAAGAPLRRVATLANFLQVWRILAACQLRPLYVAVADVAEPAPGEAGQFRDYFGCPVRFAADATRLAISVADARRPLPSANAELARRGEEVIQSYLAELDRRSVLPTVAAQVLQELIAAQFEKARVARRLGLSPSTLQRRLAAEGFTFRQVVEDTRRDLAQSYVRQGRHSFKEIAYLLGYSDLSNFSRAFRAWFGVPPKIYQERAHAAGPPAGTPRRRGRLVA